MFEIVRLLGSVTVETPLINLSPSFIVFEEPVLLREKKKVEIEVQTQFVNILVIRNNPSRCVVKTNVDMCTLFSKQCM